MPELPEVETVRLGLIPIVSRKRIISCEQRRLDLRWPLPDRMSQRLKGVSVTRISRRSKYLLLELNNLETLIIHLGMSGRLLVFKEMTQESQNLVNLNFKSRSTEKHDHIIFNLEGGIRIVYNDPRRFGAMDLFETERIMNHKWLVHLGPEPMSEEFSSDFLYRKLRQRQSSIKAALMDQKLVAGLGNIYVLESLWAAGISPKRIANKLGKIKVEELAVQIRKVLKKAISLGGTSLKDFRQVDGNLGYFVNKLNVYGREGKDCLKFECSGKIKSIKQNNRASYYCNRCQN